MARNVACVACLLALLLCGAAPLVHADAAEQPADTAAAGGGADAATPPPPAAKQRPPLVVFKQQDSWVLEGCCVAFLLTYLANIYFGKRKNEQLALAWTSELVAPDGVLDRNFALLGPGDTEAGEVLLKDSMHCYKFWASGRRFCQGLLATFQLVRRQDLLAYAVMAVRGQADVLELEVRMNEGSMPPMVMAIAPPATARTMLLDSEDVKAYCKKVEPTRDRIANWPERLTVLAEQPSLFYDLMGPPLLDLVFGKEAYGALRSYFRFLHITSEAGEGHKQVIRLSFALPPPGEGATLDAFLTLACLLTDAVGSLRLTPEQAKRAADARQKQEAAARAEAGDEARRRAEERRLAKLQEEQERLRKLPPDVREKEIAKKQKIQARRRMVRMGKNM